MGVELAREAAAADAVQALLEKIALLEVSPAVSVGEFLGSSTAVRTGVFDALRESAQVQVRLEPDQVAVAEAEVSLAELISILSRVCEAHAAGGPFRPNDFRQLVLTANVDRLTGIGLATPPDTLGLGDLCSLELDAPDWCPKSAAATGTYSPAFDDDFAPELLIAIARVEAIVSLEDQIAKLKLTRDASVGEFLAQHPDLKADVVLFTSGARLMGSAWSEDGSVETRVELPLERLWLILARAMDTVEVDLSADGALSVDGHTAP